jgi:hypothetical protein
VPKQRLMIYIYDADDHEAAMYPYVVVSGHYIYTPNMCGFFLYTTNMCGWWLHIYRYRDTYSITLGYCIGR